MIKVNVRYFNILAAYAGTRRQVLELKEGTTIRDFILQVCQSHPPAFREVVLQDGAPSPHLRLFRNDLPVEHDSLDAQLESGDVILLFPAVAGGSDIVCFQSQNKMLGILKGGRGDEIGCTSKA